MSAQTHLRLATKDRNRYKFACGVEKSRLASMVISSLRRWFGVTCGNCKRTKAYAEDKSVVR